MSTWAFDITSWGDVRGRGCGYGTVMPPSKVLFLVLGLIVAVVLVYTLVWNQAQ